MPRFVMGDLYAAAGRGDVPRVRTLLDEGADPNESGDQHGTTALIHAGFLGHVDVVALLLERGADIDRPNKHGARPLAAAAINARIAVIRRLLTAGASLSAEGNSGLTAFMDAASGSADAVRVFLEHGVDVNAVSSKGYTALESAAINRTHGPVILRMLLEAGADPTHRNGQGQTARDLALERGAVENVPVLDAWASQLGRHA